MRRDVQLFLNKDVQVPARVSTTNLYEDNHLNSEHGTIHDFVNHSVIKNGKVKLTSISGSEASISQSGLALEPSKKYVAKITGLEYPAEKLVVNRVFNSEAFNNSTWNKVSTNVTANSTSSPIGTTTADKVTRTSTGANYLKTETSKGALQETYTSSVYVKQGSGDYFAMRVQGSYPSRVDLRFRFSTGSVTYYAASSNYTAISSNAERVGNGWFRISMTYTTDAHTNVSNVLASRSTNGNIDNGDTSSTAFCYVWGYQFETGSELSPYVTNTSSTEASYSYVNRKVQTVSNYLNYSNQLSRTEWIKAGLTNTDGQLDHLGKFTGSRIQSVNSLATSYVYQENYNYTSTEDFIFSFYVKSGDANYASIRLAVFTNSGTSLYSYLVVNLSDGSTSGVSDTIGLNFTTVEYQYDGWYKVSMGGSNSDIQRIQPLVSPRYDLGSPFTSHTTAGLPYMYVSGLQLQENTTEGQYIATSSASPFIISTTPNKIEISDTVDGTGGLLEVIYPEEGTINLSIPFTTNNNTGELYLRTSNSSSTFEILATEISLFERIDASTSSRDFSVDLFDFEDISIVDKIKDVRDISKVFTEYSQKFTVPASANNNELFSHFYDEEVISGFDHRLKHAATIRIGGADYKHGRLSLLSSSMKDGRPYSYSVVFYGNTVKLNDLIGDDQLSDLTGTILDALDLEYTSANILGLMKYGMSFNSSNELVMNTTSGVSEPTPDVFVPFISADSHYFYDSADLVQVKDRVDSRNVKFGSTQAKKGIYYKDMKLAVKVKYVIQAIEEKYGIVFSDDFFNENTEAFNELSLFLHKEKGSISNQLEATNESFTLSELIRTNVSNDWRGEGGGSYGQDETGWTNDYLSIVDLDSWVSTGRLLYPDIYTYRIDYDVEVVGAGEYTIEIQDISSGATGSSDYFWAGAGNKTVSHVFTSGTLGTGIHDDVIYMHTQPRFKVTTQSGITSFAIKNFTIQYVRASSIIESPSLNDFILAYSGANATDYEYNAEASQVISGGVSLQSQLPNMKTIDFLTSIFKMFNLTAYFVPDNDISPFAGQIRVRPLDAYYLSGKEVDISSFVDSSRTIVSRNKLFSTVEYEYSDHKTLASIKQNQRTGDTFGSEVMNNLNNNLSAPIAFDGGKYKVKANFEKVMYERMTDQSDETTAMPIQWGWMASKDENPVVGKALLFYPLYEDVSTEVDAASVAVSLDFDSSIYDKSGDLVTSTHTAFSDYFRPSNSLRDNGSSLNFGSEYDEWYVWEGAGSNEKSLFSLYHKNYLTSIYDLQSRLVTVDTYLPIHIVMNLKLQDIVIINRKKYRINSLDLNITTGKAKMELMNDIAYANISVGAVSIKQLLKTSGTTVVGIDDPSFNNSVSYLVYVDGIYAKTSNSVRFSLDSTFIGGGGNSVTVRKVINYDNYTTVESEDSNAITVTL